MYSGTVYCVRDSNLPVCCHTALTLISQFKPHSETVTTYSLTRSPNSEKNFKCVPKVKLEIPEPNGILKWKRDILKEKRNFRKKNNIFQNTNYISCPDRKIYFVFANVVRFRKIAFFVSEFHIFISEGRLILEFPVSLLKHVYASFRIQLGNVVSISECGLTWDLGERCVPAARQESPIRAGSLC